ncbi:hypothetical protein PtA15_10A690 [Puccinia triticina]|uniref:Uncharacterized protein n=1 Tax=Puccinia triticina TaxID=208348 RepID=A0ABY7CVK2_9BASI|nr:uncharacterized protein PtA15_10A295 [Puccinia triticina]XP_053024821.1 uncharacterized protein PtA15_10A690 [Puccinia triticina]WAQ88874.1 hypothetical protein PtA15_10A295 [Puccinia triticina]WAQ89266.1 hypothetical protein PtA15_10A690 [Puccinia triticina]WAR58931.1 hypothetical protein PtB15_10B271 [Puccinia triticina]WAR59317.1 hypothetical protein PtB15_10B659 [Puccinia triticina]
MDFGVSEIGKKRLKGLEMPEFISLIYPRSLAGRINNQGASLGGPTPRSMKSMNRPQGCWMSITSDSWLHWSSDSRLCPERRSMRP